MNGDTVTSLHGRRFVVTVAITRCQCASNVCFGRYGTYWKGGGGGKRVRLVLSRISKHLFDGRHGESHERVCKSLRIPLHTQLESPVCSTTPSSMHTVHLLNAAFVLTTSQLTLTCQHRLQQHCSNRIFRVHVFFPPSTSMIPIESGAFNFS